MNDKLKFGDFSHPGHRTQKKKNTDGKQTLGYALISFLLLHTFVPLTFLLFHAELFPFVCLFAIPDTFTKRKKQGRSFREGYATISGKVGLRSSDLMIIFGSGGGEKRRTLVVGIVNKKGHRSKENSSLREGGDA